MTMALVVAAVVIVSIAHDLGDADKLTASTTVGLGLRLAIPIAMAGIGGMFAERSGTVNIGLEGMMVMGTVMAGYFGWHTDRDPALVAGAIGGLMAGLLMSLATTSSASITSSPASRSTSSDQASPAFSPTRGSRPLRPSPRAVRSATALRSTGGSRACR